MTEEKQHLKTAEKDRMTAVSGTDMLKSSAVTSMLTSRRLGQPKWGALTLFMLMIGFG